MLVEKGLNIPRKILFTGPPGTGKTSTAQAIAKELKLPLFVVNFSSIIQSYPGKTLANLQKLFEEIEGKEGLFLFDDLDALFLARTTNNDVAEMKRAVVVALDLLENTHLDGLLIGCTNHPELLDKAIFRRFDEIIHFPAMTEDQARKLFFQVFFPLNSEETATKIMMEKSISLKKIFKICQILANSFEEISTFEETKTFIFWNTVISQATSYFFSLYNVNFTFSLYSFCIFFLQEKNF